MEIAMIRIKCVEPDREVFLLQHSEIIALSTLVMKWNTDSFGSLNIQGIRSFIKDKVASRGVSLEIARNSYDQL